MTNRFPAIFTGDALTLLKTCDLLNIDSASAFRSLLCLLHGQQTVSLHNIYPTSRNSFDLFVEEH